MSGGDGMIRRACGADVAAVLSITRDTVSKVYPKYYPAGVVAYFLQHHNAASVREDIAGGRVWLLDVGGQPVGTVTIQDNAVTRLFVLPAFQSRGFGSRLMDFAETNVAARHDRIHVDASLAAKELYVKRGYREVRTCRIEADNGDILVYDEMEKPAAVANGGMDDRQRLSGAAGRTVSPLVIKKLNFDAQ